MPSYAVITPARDEAANLRRLGESLGAQTLTPAPWVVVDDGSTDGTFEVACELAREHGWVRVLSPGAVTPEGPLTSGRRTGRDVLAFNRGLASLAEPPEFVVKLDADVSLDSDYFERLLARFADDPSLGIASGVCLEQDRHGDWGPQNVTRSHARGAARVWRWTCLRELLPLEERLGWDVVDQLQANLRGWRTQSFSDIAFRHHRDVGARDGARRAWAAQGAVAHYTGYRFWYLVLRALHRARRDPAALALLSGYLEAALRREPRHPDRAVRSHLRRQQSLRYLPTRVREALGRPAP